MVETPVGNELFSGADRNSIPVSAENAQQALCIFCRGHPPASFYAPAFGLATISVRAIASNFTAVFA
jgi:hypothetical protein